MTEAIRSLPHKLTQSEFNERSAALAKSIQDFDTTDAQKKDIVAEYKGRLDKLEGEIRRLKRVVETWTEYRDVLCEWLRDNAHGEMRLVRVDTGAEVEKRAMNDDERQSSLPLDHGAMTHAERMAADAAAKPVAKKSKARKADAVAPRTTVPALDDEEVLAALAEIDGASTFDVDIDACEMLASVGSIQWRVSTKHLHTRNETVVPLSLCFRDDVRRALLAADEDWDEIDVHGQRWSVRGRVVTKEPAAVAKSKKPRKG
jgi:hypothetical protein